MATYRYFTTVLPLGDSANVVTLRLRAINHQLCSYALNTLYFIVAFICFQTQPSVFSPARQFYFCLSSNRDVAWLNSTDHSRPDVRIRRRKKLTIGNFSNN